MLHIGCHLSVSKGYSAMAQEALSLGADTFAFFTRNPRGGAAKPLDMSDIAAFNSILKDKNFEPLVAHSPYTLNPCAAKPELRKYALETMLDDLQRMSKTPGNCYNFHPGCHVGQGDEEGIRLTAEHLAQVAAKSYDCNTKILVETMAGKGSEVGKTFEQVNDILTQAQAKYEEYTAGQNNIPDFYSFVGVCVDTCHIWEGGYDIVNNLDEVMTHFDKVVGLEKIHAVHLNDSMNDMSAHKDRHQKIGEGHIGLEALVRVINHPALKNLPFILETPNENEGYKKEIDLLRSRFLG